MKNNINGIFLLFLLLSSSLISQTHLQIPDDGWNVWLDTAAQWKNDSLFLPDEVNLNTLPVNRPTGGWESLNQRNARQVTLPATVEQYFWGATGYRPYRNGEYAYEQEDPTVFNGNYLGVSWWWRDVEVPKSFKGKHVLLHIRGARLRAEVFVNEKLVGYNIITEIPFSCDISSAILPGKKNRIAIRITNPGGRLDWVDTELMTWGNTQQRFHKSHGFGGLDRGMEITAHDSLMISDAWVLNTDKVNTIRAYAIVKNLSSKTLKATMHFAISAISSKRRDVVAERTLVLLPGAVDTIVMQLENKKAKLWSNETPNLYHLNISISSAKPKYTDLCTVTFGYRWFDAEGIGNNAMLRFNGKRIRLTSAISWGFWGLNGLFPTRELAEREVTAAKSLGLNCIQFHRNIGKEEVLDAQDRLGLMRYMEPGGGQTALGEKFSLYASSPTAPVDVSGKNGEPQTFAERYMEEKIVRMVRAYRSHPSLLLYAIQNEIHPDLQNPRIFHLLRRIHQEDPSRIVVLKSGFPSGSPSTNQAWMKPYSNEVMYDSGNAYSGWWDDHTVGGPGVWRDELYKNPTEFTHRSTNDKEIVMWGEMLGAAVPDNHKRMVEEINRLGGNSYDLKEHQEILSAYNSFIDRWGFRKAFPDVDALFVSIGNKSYDFWGRVIETARLAEANDYFVISGWESTAIENHSGLVDNLRMFKGEPSLLKNRLAPLRIAIKTSSVVYAVGDSLFVDLYLLNETHQPHPTFLSLYITYPSLYSKFVGTFVVPNFETDKFVYPVVERFPLGTVEMEGEYTITAKLQTIDNVTTDEKVLVVQPASSDILQKKRIGVISSLPELQTTKEIFPGVTAEPYKAGERYDLLLAANRFTRPAATQTDPTTEIQGTDDDEIYRTINYGDANSMEFLIPNLPKDSAVVTLKFAELFQNAVNMRVFDVALNGTVVLKDFDVFKFAGGKNIAFDTSFNVFLTNGALHITFPRVPKPSARICGIKIEMKDTVVAINCGGHEYRDKQGVIWKPYGPPQHLNAAILEEVKRGVPLVVLSEGQAATEAFGRELGDAGAFHYNGCLSEAFASWMGSWYFVRSHPVYDGLPANCAMGSYYQVPVTNGTGMLIDGENVEIFAAYSRDHSRQIAAASFVTQLGKGKVIVHTIPGMVSNLLGERAGIHPVMFQRLLFNSLHFALSTR